MTDKRTIKFELQVEADTKGVDRFDKSLRDLEKSAPIADRELRKVRQGILEFSEATGSSIRSLQAQEAALKSLQNESRAGGPLWRQLGKDIAGISEKVGQLTGAIRTAEQAQKALSLALNAPLGNTFGKLAEQTGTLKREIQQLKFRSDEYLTTLTRIKEVETFGSFQQGRLNTIAANQAFMGATLSRGYGASANLPNLPDTLAGDAQRVSELTERIRNLDRGSELYLQTVKELATAQAQAAASQSQLNRAVDGGAASYERLNATQQRRDAKLGAIGEYYASGDIAARRNDGFGDRPQAQRTANGTFIAPPYRGGNFTGIGDAGFGQFGPETPQDFQRRVEPLIQAVNDSGDRYIRAREELNRRIVEKSVKQERLLVETEDRLAQEQLTAQKRRDDELLRDFDNRLERRTRQREQRRRNIRAAGEIATAVGVAGYFGGPEAVAGAAAGAIFGPGGAQVGTTLGLAAGGLRQQVAGFSDQSAQLNKLQISLKSIAGSEAEYTRAMNAITSANREFNIPLLEGTRAMTQLTAAVKGAGGTVADAEIAYRGITAAIKATGGSSADAEGAIRALVQTFSKGKVSAEEIRQQLAERLPGAVTLFAQATGRTGAELDKAFEKGEVGLNDLMKFLATLNTRYSETARRLAASNDEAGLRLQLRWEQTTLAIGKAFAPLGAEIQNTLTNLIANNESTIRSITDSIIDSARSTGKVINDITYEVKKYSWALNAIPKVIETAIKIIPFGFDTSALPISRYLQSQNIINQNNKFDSLNYIPSLGGSAQDPSVFKDQLKKARKNIAEANKKINNYGPPILPDAWKELDALRSTADINLIKEQQLVKAILDAGKSQKKPAARRPVSQNPAGQDDKTLAAIKKRDEDLLDARQRKEQRIADIRKQATEQIIELEKKFAEDRINSEREIQRIRRQIQASQEETSRISRLQAGEDPAIIEVERQISKISRDAVEAKIEAEQSIKDKEREQTKLINDLQKQTANQINKENESYSRRIGEIQKDYARKTGKIIEDSTIKSAQRIESAAKSLSEALKQNFAELENSLKRERQAWNIVRQLQGVRPIPEPSGYSRDGRPVYGMPADGVPDMFRNIDQKLYRFNKRQSSSSIGSPSRSTIGDQFISLLGTQGGYEDIAGLQPLPIQRMQRQAARPLQAIWKMMGYGTIDQYMPEWAQKKNRPALHKKVLERIQRMDEIRRNWNPLDAEWKERSNRNNPAPRSKPAAGGIDTFYQIQKTLEKSVINRLIPTGVPLRGDLSDYLTPNELRVLRSSLKDLGKKGGSYVDGRNTFGKAVNSIKQEYGMRVWDRPDSVSNPLESIGDDVEWLRQYQERTDPPLIKPGVGSQFEGASLPGGIGNQFLSMISKSGGYGQVATTGNSVYRLPVNAFPAAGEATRGRQQELGERNTSIDLNTTNETLSVFQEITAQSEATKRNLIDQIKQQQVQADLIRRGVNPAIADQLATLEMAYQKEVRLIEAARNRSMAEGTFTAEIQRSYEVSIARAGFLLNENKRLTEEYEKQRRAMDNSFGFRDGARQYVESIGTMREATATLTQTGIKGVEDALFSLATTGTANFQAFAASILQDTARMIIQQLVLKTVMQAIGFIGGGGSSIVKGVDVPIAQLPAGMGFAKGGAFSEKGIQLFAQGGIVDKPTLFPFAKGIGLMGEAGPEAIMPLKRGRDGKLGVTNTGNSTTNVVVNVDAKGTSVSGDESNGAALGRLLAGAVQQELLKQKRPGGLLAS